MEATETTSQSPEFQNLPYAERLAILKAEAKQTPEEAAKEAAAAWARMDATRR